MWKRMGLDLIPFIDFWPYRYFGVRKQEKLEWEAYEIAKEAIEELHITQAQAAELQEQIKSQGIEEANEQAQEQLAA